MSTTLEPERVNSGPVTPILVHREPTAMMNTSMPICVRTGVISICNHLLIPILSKTTPPGANRVRGRDELYSIYMCSITVARAK